MDDTSRARRARFEALYADNFRPLLGYVVRRSSQPANAADVVAETFLVAWRRLDDVPSDERARLWLYGVAHRVLANAHRGQRRRAQLGERLAGALARHVPDHADTVELTADVRDVLACLPAGDRELLRLTTWEGLTGPEVAVVLGIPPSTVRTRLQRLRRRLRDAVDGPTARDGDTGRDSSGSSGHVTGRRPTVPEPGGHR
jgi:RNA polymerase sigma factor (sigma-70 family)